MRCNILTVTLGTATFMLLGAHANAKDFSATFSGFEELGEINAETGAIFSPGTATLDLGSRQKGWHDYLQAEIFRLDLGSHPSSHSLRQGACGGRHHGILLHEPRQWSDGHQLPTPSGKVTGTITSASVVGITTQNVPVGDFSALVAALVSNTAYANIHTVNFPAGEIRGQILKSDSQE